MLGNAITVCPVAGLVTCEKPVSDTGAVKDGSCEACMLDMADASSLSFSSESCDRMDCIPLAFGRDVTVVEVEEAEEEESCGS